MEQFPYILAELRDGMKQHGISLGLLTGDLNTKTNTPENEQLVDLFDDTNISPTNTMADEALVAGRWAPHMLRYYDRVLQVKPGQMQAADWEAQQVNGLSDHKIVMATLVAKTPGASPMKSP